MGYARQHRDERRADARLPPRIQEGEAMFAEIIPEVGRSSNNTVV
ncbi:hypothetical protein [Microbacterium sp. NPDC055521]